MGILAGDKFKPALFLGLGGNGGKIINQLAGRLKRHPHWERIAPLTHFIALDTNKADLDALSEVRPDNRFLLSNFDAQTYVSRKQGRAELDEDTLVTQWWPQWYQPRPGMSPGAGQIRIESRLKLYYNLEEDRCGLRRKVSAAFDTMTARENPWRDDEDRSIRVYMYCSVAGGTGSGGFLPMAYLMRQWVEDHGWGRPNVVGILTLPTTFLSRVRPELHKDIAANGYAALKELEYLTRMLGYAGGADELEFHFDPGTLDRRRIYGRGRPFSLTYLIDKPEQLSIQKYEHAVADASFLQIFSPLLGAQAGEYDNYEKHQRTLAQGHFSVNHGSFGTSLLQLPRRDLLRYAGMRYVAKALGDWLTFGAGDPEFRIPYADPAFQRLSDQEKARRIDDAFERYVVSRAQAEERAEEKGIFTQIHQLKGKGGADLPTRLRESFAALYRRLDELITVAPVDPMSINPGNPSIQRAVANLREDVTRSRQAVRLYLEAQLAELRAGRFFERFFAEHEVNPIAQRLLLVRTLRTAFLTPAIPSGDANGGESDADYAFLAEAGTPVDFDADVIRTEVDKRNQELNATANPGFLSRMTDRDNAAFQGAKRKAVGFLESLEADCRDEMKRTFWRTFEAELRRVGETVLQSFRKVAEVSDEAARLASTEAERFRKDPGAFPDSEIAQYYLDAEALRDDRRKERLWALFYEHLLDRDSYFDAPSLFRIVAEAFQPARDPDGRLRAKDATEIVRQVREALAKRATEVYGQAMEDLSIDLSRALDLEQRYIALMDDGRDWADLRRRGALEDTLRAVSASRVRQGVEDRLVRTFRECVVLAHVDASRRDDPTVTPADVFYVGLHERFDSDEEGSLGSVLRNVVPGLNLVPGWTERDSLVMYRGVLGVPLYWFKNVGAVLEPAYKRVYADPNRSYPLHIERTWERDPGLPNLDPVEVKAAETRRRAEEQARAQVDAQRGRMRSFLLCELSGAITGGEAGYTWNLSGAQAPLGAARHQAFAAFQAIDATLRGILERGAEDHWARQAAERSTRARLVEQVQALHARLTAAFAAAVAAQADAERRHLTEELEVVQGLLGQATGG
jgi:hypothetical protein